MIFEGKIIVYNLKFFYQKPVNGVNLNENYSNNELPIYLDKSCATKQRYGMSLS